MEWVLVPKDPTPQMIAAMIATMPRKRSEFQSVSEEVKHLRRWRAALNSAPQPPADAVSIQHPYK